MKKLVVSRENLQNVLAKANVTGEFLEVSYENGIVIAQNKNLQCVYCGCNDESKLIVTNGVHTCTECIKDLNDFADRTEGI